MRISGRRVMPESSVPWRTSATTLSRSSSVERPGWRISTISWSFISLRDHWMVPMPMNSSARPRVRPSDIVEAPTPASVSWLELMSKAK